MPWKKKNINLCVLQVEDNQAASRCRLCINDSAEPCSQWHPSSRVVLLVTGYKQIPRSPESRNIPVHPPNILSVSNACCQGMDGRTAVRLVTVYRSIVLKRASHQMTATDFYPLEAMTSFGWDFRGSILIFSRITDLKSTADFPFK